MSTTKNHFLFKSIFVGVILTAMPIFMFNNCGQGFEGANYEQGDLIVSYLSPQGKVQTHEVTYTKYGEAVVVAGDYLISETESFDKSDTYAIGSTISQKAIASSGLSNARQATAKGAYMRLWQDGVIPYKIDSSFGEKNVNIIKSYIENFNQLMNANSLGQRIKIEFIEQPSISSGAYTNFKFKPGLPCSANVGYTGGEASVHLNLSCIDEPTVHHEMMHILGFLHEHSREDRNRHIVFNPQNIDKTTDDQFKIWPGTSSSKKYDTESIMHYSSYAYSNNNSPVLMKINGDEIQKNNKLSNTDFQGLLDVYGAAYEDISYNPMNITASDIQIARLANAPNSTRANSSAPPIPSLTFKSVGATRFAVNFHGGSPNGTDNDNIAKWHGFTSFPICLAIDGALHKMYFSPKDKSEDADNLFKVPNYRIRRSNHQGGSISATRFLYSYIIVKGLNPSTTYSVKAWRSIDCNQYGALNNENASAMSNTISITTTGENGGSNSLPAAANPAPVISTGILDDNFEMTVSTTRDTGISFYFGKKIPNGVAIDYYLNDDWHSKQTSESDNFTYGGVNGLSRSTDYRLKATVKYPSGNKYSKELAFRTAGNSIGTQATALTTSDTTESYISNFTAQALSHNQVRLNWTARNGARKFNISANDNYVTTVECTSTCSHTGNFNNQLRAGQTNTFYLNAILSRGSIKSKSNTIDVRLPVASNGNNNSLPAAANPAATTNNGNFNVSDLDLRATVNSNGIFTNIPGNANDIYKNDIVQYDVFVNNQWKTSIKSPLNFKLINGYTNNQAHLVQWTAIKSDGSSAGKTRTILTQTATNSGAANSVPSINNGTNSTTPAAANPNTSSQVLPSNFNLRRVSATPVAITIGWEQAIPSGVHIDLFVNGQWKSKVTSIGNNFVSTTIGGLSAGRSYRVKATVKYSSGEKYSNEHNFRTDSGQGSGGSAAAPPTPNLSFKSASNTSVELKFPGGTPNGTDSDNNAKWHGHSAMPICVRMNGENFARYLSPKNKTSDSADQFKVPNYRFHKSNYQGGYVSATRFLHSYIRPIGLQPNTTYTFSAWRANDCRTQGPSDGRQGRSTSAISNTIRVTTTGGNNSTPAAANPSGAPLPANFSLTKIGSFQSSAIISWGQRLPEGTKVDFYLNDQWVSHSKSSSGVSGTITNLSPNTEYRLKMTSTTSGRSSYSRELIFRTAGTSNSNTNNTSTPAAANPSTSNQTLPNDFNLRKVGATPITITIGWDQAIPNGVAVDLFVNGQWNSKVTSNGNNFTSTPIGGLRPGTTYRIKATVKYSSGEKYSKELNASTNSLRGGGGGPNESNNPNSTTR